MRFGHNLQPDRLPDARYRRVPDAVRAGHLLSSRLVVVVGRVPPADDDFLFPLNRQRIGYVEIERVVTAFVFANPLAIGPDGGMPIHGAEMKQQSPPRKIIRLYEPAVIEQEVCSIDRLLDAGEGGFHGKGNEDFPAIYARIRRLGGFGPAEIPKPVEVYPAILVAPHSWARVLAPGFIRRNFLGPSSHDVARNRRPRIGGGLSGMGRQSACKEQQRRGEVAFHTSS